MPRKTINVDYLYSELGKVLYLRNEIREMLELILAAIITKRWDLEPFWLIFIGGPSSGKSIILEAVNDTTVTYYLDALTENALASGFRDENYEKNNNNERVDAGMAHLLHNKTLLMKDLTLLLSNSSIAQTIMNQFRLFYDGTFRKGFGNDNALAIHSRFNFVGACTEVIDNLTASSVSLGERFLYYRLPPWDELEEDSLCRRALDDTYDFRANKRRWDTLVQTFVNKENTRFVKPTLPDKVQDVLIHLARFIVSFRREPMVKGIVSSPTCEAPTRVVKQLFTGAAGVASVNRRQVIGQYELDLLSKIALSSMIGPKLDIVKYLFLEAEGCGATQETLVGTLRLSRSAAEKILEGMYVMDLVTKSVDGKVYYTLSPKANKLIESAKLEDLLSN